MLRQRLRCQTVHPVPLSPRHPRFPINNRLPRMRCPSTPGTAAISTAVSRRSHRLWIGVTGFILAATASTALAAPPSAEDIVRTPASTQWALSLTHRSRYQQLRHDFRADSNAHSYGFLSQRSFIGLRIDHSSLQGLVQIQDSRAYQLSGPEENPPLTASIVNPVDLLQASLIWSDTDYDGATLRVQGGRFTMGLGSGRLISGTPYRNTMNAYTGLRLDRKASTGQTLTAFVTQPLQRLPNDAVGLADNTLEQDRERSGTTFSGLLATAPLPLSMVGEMYVYALNETDTPGTRTRNRRLVTPGLRISPAPQPGAWSGDLEWIGQWGQQRASTASDDTTDLAHKAYAAHAELGYRFAVMGLPEIIAVADLASGDHNPTDGYSQRFDSLFVGRRYSFGPTDFYGAFTRSNLRSAGLRLRVTHPGRGDAFIAWRHLALDRTRDAWVPARLQDASGQSGRELGQQVDLRIRATILPARLTLETGYTYFSRGRFAREVSGGPTRDTQHIYTQFTLHL